MKKIDLSVLKTHLARPRKTERQLVLVRSAESVGNISGTLTGWMDSKLTDFGRKQAFSLNPALEDVEFSSWYSSDL